MKNDIVSRLLSGTFFTGIGNTVDKLANLVSFVLLVRFISKEEVGTVVIVLISVNIYKIINNLLLDELWVAKTISSSSDKKEYLSCLSITYNFLTSILFLPVVLISFPLIIEKFDLASSNNLYICVASIFILNSISGMLLRVLQGWHKYKKIGFLQSILGSSRLLFIVVFIVIFDSGLDGVLISYVLSFLLLVLMTLRALPFKITPTFSYYEYKKLLVRGFLLSVNNLLTFIYTKIDRVIVTSFIGVASLAIYESATKIPQNIRFLYKSYIYVLFPNVSELYSQGNHDEIRAILNNSIRIITFFSCFVCVFVFVFQQEITVFLFSSEYSEGAPVLAILSLALCIALVSNLIGTTLVALGHPDKPAKINIVETITNITANIVLIPLYGLTGAAFATLLSRCLTNPVNLYFLKKTEVFVDVSQYIKPLMVCVFIIIIDVSFSPTLLFSKLLLILSYPVLCYFLSIFYKSDLVYIYNQVLRHGTSES